MRYCFACPILLGQVGIEPSGHITLATMAKTTKSENKNSPRVNVPCSAWDTEVLQLHFVDVKLSCAQQRD